MQKFLDCKNQNSLFQCLQNREFNFLYYYYILISTSDALNFIVLLNR